ncbi:ArsC family transcriptional regulator [Erysipelothrix larvae]|uniref:ArsC family transcriptional regulator n=1 Tax=Erysipelothrix larvae TaxID=1514105 RepID=A0A120JTQ5_9FIRM|nr:arsenate reductase ArsC [Erysipelothrix larvae]AMC93600.1 ArsC family transcriptional regulator [Erysipelothrix larvae]
MDQSVKPKVAFICVHNSCRSQIAEAIATLKYSDIMEAYSAGTEKKDQINPDAVRIFKARYDIDMSTTQSSKTLDLIPTVDIVVTMGCNVDCPWLPCKHREDWNLDDPSGKSDAAFEYTIDQIELKMKDLMRRLKDKEIEVD